MTGLPPLPALPPPCPRPEIVGAAARHWVTAAVAVADTGVDVTRALDGAHDDWAGLAAGAAVRRAGAEQETCESLAAIGLGAAEGVAAWAGALRHLAERRSALHHDRDHLAGRRSSLEPLPDDRPDAAALRRSIWRAHDALVTTIAAWSADLARSEQAFADGLSAVSRRPLTEAMDRAHRALLALADSPAADATRRALAAGAQAGRPGLLLAWDPDAFDGDGRVVIAYGDPVAADAVAVVVPGITSQASTVDTVGTMAIAVGGAAAAAAPSRRTSSIAWLGYDAPSGRDLTGTVGTGAAEAGADELEEFVGRWAVRSTAVVTVVGHSYGSTTAATAARDGMDADRLVLLGSPGAGKEVQVATDLHLPTFVASSDLDPASWAGSRGFGEGPGALGVDPAQAVFGATRLPTDAAVAPHLDDLERFVDIHAGYVAPGSVTLAAVGEVITGERPDAVPGRSAGGTLLASTWMAGRAAERLTHWR